MTMLKTVMVLVALLAAVPAGAQDKVYPVIAGHGGIVVVPHAANRPDPHLRYRVVVSVTSAGGLEAVARLVNLLGQAGVRPRAGDIVPIVHGAATPSILSPSGYGTRHGGATNPDADLLAKLAAAGYPVHVCAQALAGGHIPTSDVAKEVVVDDSALTTIATLQLKGYALIEE